MTALAWALLGCIAIAIFYLIRVWRMWAKSRRWFIETNARIEERRRLQQGVWAPDPRPDPGIPEGDER